WRHRLRDDPLWLPARRIVRTVVLTRTTPPEHLGRLAEQYRAAVQPQYLQDFARSLGLSVDSLLALSIGSSARPRPWACPVTDPDNKVLGIRLRRLGGGKFAVKGGKEGLFIPATAEVECCFLFICEGPTDAAALLDMGFANVVGRPSCTGGIKLLVELVRRRQPPEVVIVGDGDEPGRRG